jgi:hypothetical protein
MAGGMLDNNILGHIITVDSYDDRGLSLRFSNRVKTLNTVKATIEEKGVSSYITPIKGLTAEVAKDFQDKEFVFVFIDADHSYEGCKADFEAWSPLVRSGGEVAFHDIQKEEVQLVIQEAGWNRYDVETIGVLTKP